MWICRPKIKCNSLNGIVCLQVVVACFVVFIRDGKGKAIPLQAWTGPDGSRRLRFPDFKTIGTWRWQGCQPCAPAAFYPQEIFPVLISVRGWVDPRGHSAARRIMSMKNSNDTIGNRTRDLLTCSAVPQPTAPPRSPHKGWTTAEFLTSLLDVGWGKTEHVRTMLSWSQWRLSS